MKLLATTLLAGTAAASSFSINADSKAGQQLLSKARRLSSESEESEDGGDMSWANSYSIKFEKCATTRHPWSQSINNWKNLDNGEYNEYNGGNGLYLQSLVHFKLCPEDHCHDNCAEGGEYVVDMYEFLDTYISYRQNHKCSNVANHCYCENAYDDEACLDQCYLDEGGDVYDLCSDEEGWQGFSLAEATTCQALEINANQNYEEDQQDNAQTFYLGPECGADGDSIFLRLFTDDLCSFYADKGVFESVHGRDLPYSSRTGDSLVRKDYCLSCSAGNYETTEACQDIYADSGKCEENMKDTGRYHNTRACKFIKGLTQHVEDKGNKSMVDFLAGAFAVSTLVLGVVAHSMNRKLKRSKVTLLHDEGQARAVV